MKTRKGLLMGANKGKRVSAWFVHFKNLLGKTPNADGSEEAISSIFENLNIDDGPFIADEYTKANTKWPQVI